MTAPKLDDSWTMFKAGCERLQMWEISRASWWWTKISGKNFAPANVLCWSGHPKPHSSSGTSNNKMTTILSFLTAKLCMRSYRKQRTCQEQTHHHSLQRKKQEWPDPVRVRWKSNFSRGRWNSSLRWKSHLSPPWISLEENIARR